LNFVVDNFRTPIGQLHVVEDDDRNLRAVYWADHEASLHRWLEGRYGKGGYRLGNARERLDSADALLRYFAGELTAIDEQRVKFEGTAFQQDVWNALRRIRCGTTISYGQLAKQIGRPAAVRAVGLANGSNPIGVVVPCHRVIGSNGSLTGYGGGIERKSWLLRHEGAIAGRTLFDEIANVDLRSS
jgi:methylated-DNA-[protein]-cysteine S-methyltransferase